MDYVFKYNFVKIAPRKIRLVTNLAKSFSLSDALAQLKFLRKNASKPVYEIIKSAIAALKEKSLDLNNFKIKSLTCDSGAVLKRRHYKSRGRTAMIKKRSSHIKLVITEIKSTDKSKQNKNIENKQKRIENGTKSQPKKSTKSN